jgi:hyperosmotically inducible protein
MLRNILIIITGLILVFTLIGCGSNQPIESSNYYAHDDAITARVKSAYLKDPTLHHYHIDVETENRVVTLSGYVNSPITSDRATSVAQTVHGVRDVNNNLEVKY